MKYDVGPNRQHDSHASSPSAMNPARSFVLLSLLLAAGCGRDPVLEDAETPVPAIDDSDELISTVVTPSQLRARLGPGAEDALIRADGGRIRIVSLEGTGITDLSPLEGLPLTMLTLTGLEVADLEPLRGMPLEQLVLDGTRVKDLSPLEGMPLRVLFLRQTPVEDLGPLAKLPLETLDLAEAKSVADLAPLSGSTTLRNLYLNETAVEDLSPLAGLPLQQLNALGTKVSNVEALKDLDLDILWLTKTNVSDLSSLAGSALTSLDVEGTPVADLSVIPRIEGLERLNIVDTAVTDLAPLAGLELVRLLFTPSKIEKGLEVVREMETLDELDVTFREPERLDPEEFWKRYEAGEFKGEEATEPPANEEAKPETRPSTTEESKPTPADDTPEPSQPEEDSPSDE